MGCELKLTSYTVIEVHCVKLWREFKFEVQL